jgi:hypothetical protein
MYIHRIADGLSAKDAFLNMQQAERDWLSKTNQNSLFLNFKRYQILDLKKYNEPMENKNVIRKLLLKYNLKNNCCGCFLLANEQYQFILPYEVETN